MLLHPYSLGTIQTLQPTLHVGAHITNSTAPNYKYAPHCQISKRWTVTLLQCLEIHLPHRFIALIPCGYSEFSSTVMGLLQLQYDSNTSYR
ncbi:putative hemoglobin subunit alpha-1 [Trichinella spiralis]|uniref:putative hemoglobin subunit alpha-1 n=1 Tax=Trichinella spiralis TaxID=6334 RepID=UPI0001EFC47E|nr:putative hemoglobin subunit alpha-1 [Trichinella spiralis]